MCLSLLGLAPSPHEYRRRWFAPRREFFVQRSSPMRPFVTHLVLHQPHSGFVLGVP